MGILLNISDSAKTYLVGLLEKRRDESSDEDQEKGEIGIRVFVQQPGTPHAETCIAYCRSKDTQEDDIPLDVGPFITWIEQRSEPFLEDAEVDYREDQFGGQLTIRAPNARAPKVSDDSPLEDRINYVLYTEINPGLASHGGAVSLVEVVDGDTAILQFGGGCQGCAAVDITLKHGVEQALIAAIPELNAIRDVTDHSFTENAYYQPQ